MRRGGELGGLRVEIPLGEEGEEVPGNDLPAGLPQKSLHLLQPQRGGNLERGQEDVLLLSQQRHLRLQ